MNSDKIKLTVFSLVILLIFCCFNTQIMHLGTLPLHKKITVGDALDLGFSNTSRFISALQVDISDNNSMISNNSFNLANSAPVLTTPGKIDVNLKLFGIIPLRQVTVDVVPQTKVIPGGHSVGIMLHSHGVMVVGISTLENSKGLQCCPAKDAGIKIGDVLLKINNIPVKTEYQVREIITDYGQKKKPLTMELERQGRKFTVKITPVYNEANQQYAVGLLIRDSAAGVGTLTFYEPKTKVYGALGHLITDIDTGKKVNMSNGRIIGAYIQEINAGQKGLPGEKIGMLETNSSISGSIEINTNHGIFGKMLQQVNNPFFKKPIPVAINSQVKEGPAEIITVLSGSKMEKFQVKIEKVSRQSQPEGKGMVIKITDPCLLDITGGIIQGMSGSPIIQYHNGQPYLVGAVTHVFINDPTRGYGVLAEWMMQEIKTMSMDEPRKKKKNSATESYKAYNAA